jgi:hypothetical protein
VYLEEESLVRLLGLARLLGLELGLVHLLGLVRLLWLELADILASVRLGLPQPLELLSQKGLP